MIRYTLFAISLCAAISTLGCIGIHDNSALFLNPPKEGTPEGNIIRTYGTPAFSGFAENEKIYTYRVRDNRFYILISSNSGYDLVVTCKNGEVSSVDKVVRPSTFSLLYPTPWAETE